MKKETRKKISRLLIVVIVITAIALAAYFLLKRFGLLNISLLREFVNKGAWGFIAFLLLQIFQVIFIPLNTSMFTIPAIILFGPVKGFLVCWIGCSIGSILLFIIVKSMGSKALKWVIGEDGSKKFQSFINKGKYILPILLLVPIFPDDVVCASAGLSSIKLPYFAATVVVTRAIDSASTAFIGSALIKSVLGIVFLCVYVLAMIALSYFITKNHDKLESYINKFIQKLKRRKNT